MNWDWLDLYCDARVAFVKHPDVRISVQDAYIGYFHAPYRIIAQARIDDQMFAVSWSPVSEGRYTQQRQAEAAVASWEHAKLERETWIAYDREVAENYAHRGGLHLRVNKTWGSEMRMRFEKDRVLVVSPAAYRDLMQRTRWNMYTRNEYIGSCYDDYGPVE